MSSPTVSYWTNTQKMQFTSLIGSTYTLTKNPVKMPIVPLTKAKADVPIAPGPNLLNGGSEFAAAAIPLQWDEMDYQEYLNLQQFHLQPCTMIDMYDNGYYGWLSLGTYDSLPGVATKTGQVKAAFIVSTPANGLKSVVTTIPINLAPDSDTLNNWTLTNLTKSTGGPSGAIDAEASGSGSPVGSNAILDRVINVVMGKTYTPSFFIDPSQITNNNGSTPNVLTEFVGSKQNSDGTYSNVNGTLSATLYTFTVGKSLFVSVDVEDIPAGNTHLILTNGTNQYDCSDQSDGNFVVYKKVNATQTGVWSSHAGGAGTNGFPSTTADMWTCSTDSNFHRITLAVVAGASGANSIVASWDGRIVSFTDNATGGTMDLTASNWQVRIITNTSSGVIKNYTINPQITIGINTADNLTQILQQYVALNTTTAGRYATSAWTCATNLAPHSDDLLGYAHREQNVTVNPTGGPNGATASAEYIGTGLTSAYEYIDWTVNVVPGQTYAFSTWVDPSHILSGTCWLGIWHQDFSAAYIRSTVTNGGVAARYSAATWTAPAGVTQIAIRFEFQAAVASGQKLRFSQPMFEPASTPSGYYISSQNPQVHVYAELLSSANVASGQKFKISQPMLRTDGVYSTYAPQSNPTLSVVSGGSIPANTTLYYGLTFSSNWGQTLIGPISSITTGSSGGYAINATWSTPTSAYFRRARLWISTSNSFSSGSTALVKADVFSAWNQSWIDYCGTSGVTSQDIVPSSNSAYCGRWAGGIWMNE